MLHSKTCERFVKMAFCLFMLRSAKSRSFCFREGLYQCVCVYVFVHVCVCCCCCCCFALFFLMMRHHDCSCTDLKCEL